MVQLETGSLQLIDQMVVDQELPIASDVNQEGPLQQTGNIRSRPLSQQRGS